MAYKDIATLDEFKTEVVEADKLVVVDFWAPWCGPCKMLGPIFEKTSEEVDNAKFVKVDIDDAEEIAEKFNIMAVPTLIFVKDGQVVDQKSGAMTKDQLKAAIESNL